MQVERRAPAKINLFLHVATRGDDGFHRLSSWFCTVGLFDTLTLHFDGKSANDGEPPRASLGRAGEPLLSLATDDPRLPTDARNLVMRAMAALADAMSRAGTAAAGERGEASPASIAIRAVSAFLVKRIPSGAGLGGGSSDAAAALLAMNEGLSLHWPVETLAAIAELLGSDVPFFLHAPSALCAGRGEVIRPLAPPAVAKWATLVLPQIEMPTPAVFKQFDAMGSGDVELATQSPDDVAERNARVWSRRTMLSSERLLPLLANDLEPAAFALRPELRTLRSGIEQTLGRIVRMSGSGSALFTLFDDESSATRAAETIERVNKVRTRAVELAPGVLASASTAFSEP